MKRKYEPPLIKKIFIHTSAMIAGSDPPIDDPVMSVNNEVAEEQM